MRNIISIIFILFINYSIAQRSHNNDIDSIFIYARNLDVLKSIDITKKSSLPDHLKLKIFWFLNYLQTGEKSRLDIIDTIINGTSKHKMIDLIVRGNYHYNVNLNDSIAYDLIYKAKELALLLKDSIFVSQSYRDMFAIAFNNVNKIRSISQNEFINYKKFSYDQREKFWSTYYSLRYYSQKNDVENINDFEAFIKVINEKKFPYVKARAQQFLGILYWHFKKEYQESNSYYRKAIKNYRIKDLFMLKEYILKSKINIGNNLISMKKYSEALEYMKYAINTEQLHHQPQDFSITYNIISKAYSKIGQTDSAYFYLLKKNYYDSLVDNQNISKAISSINIKYQTEKKEKDILQLKAKRKQDRTLILSTILFILFGSTVSYLMLKNSKRKQLLAEQEKLLETQKNLTLLKEQEITTINAMVAGQEKERKRVAEDLHDNLGSVLATLKLHFENLKINREKKKIDQETLFDKTENLIDEAYLKVRSIAHAKNAGVIAHKGLLVAVQMMAEKISSANKTTIEVVHFGLEKPIENSLEIAVFRIIQELTTNIIKHAHATKATINMSQYENTLNIIVEDNGKGFDKNTIEYHDGLGLGSIKTRIKHFKGTFSIDATPGKGTTILFNIPIKRPLH